DPARRQHVRGDRLSPRMLLLEILPHRRWRVHENFGRNTGEKLLYPLPPGLAVNDAQVQVAGAVRRSPHNGARGHDPPRPVAFLDVLDRLPQCGVVRRRQAGPAAVALTLAVVHTDPSQSCVLPSYTFSSPRNPRLE